MKLRLKWDRQDEFCFRSHQHFVKPAGVSPPQWQQIFNEAVMLGEQSEWKQVAWDINHEEKMVFAKGSLHVSPPGGRDMSL